MAKTKNPHAGQTFSTDLVVVGTRFRVKTEVQKILATRTPFNIRLEREYSNKKDHNAIMVIIDDPKRGALNGKQVGYVRAVTAATFAEKMDDGEIEFKSGRVVSVEPEYGGDMDMEVTWLKTDKFIPLDNDADSD